MFFLLSTPIAEWTNTLPQSQSFLSFLPGFEYLNGHARKLPVVLGKAVVFLGTTAAPQQTIGKSQFSLIMAEKATMNENPKLDVLLVEPIYMFISLKL